MRFLLDNDVPKAVADLLGELGHDVVWSRDVLAKDAKDQLVAAASEHDDRILITLDRDYQQLDPVVADGRRRFRRLSRIWLRCRPTRCAERMRLFMTEIEWEERRHRELGIPKMLIHIFDQGFKTHR